MVCTDDLTFNGDELPSTQFSQKIFTFVTQEGGWLTDEQPGIIFSYPERISEIFLLLFLDRIKWFKVMIFNLYYNEKNEEYQRGLQNEDHHI